jgi:hypothetical protein
MRKRTRTTLAVIAFAFALFVSVNLPVFGYTNCRGTTFESILQYGHQPCGGFVTLDAIQPSLQAGNTAYAYMNATSKLTLPLNNVGCQTFIQAISLSGGNLTSTINSWSMTPDSNALIDLYSSNSSNAVAGCSGTTLVFYPISTGSSEIITAGEALNYLVVFANGDSITGTVIAQ